MPSTCAENYTHSNFNTRTVVYLMYVHAVRFSHAGGKEILFAFALFWLRDSRLLEYSANMI